MNGKVIRNSFHYYFSLSIFFFFSKEKNLSFFLLVLGCYVWARMHISCFGLFFWEDGGVEGMNFNGFCHMLPLAYSFNFLWFFWISVWLYVGIPFGE